MQHSKRQRIWTVTEAKARLSEILRLAEKEGPQYISDRRSFVVMPAEMWHAKSPPRQSLGKWLVEDTPRGIELEVPDRHEPDRPIPFIDEEDE